MYENKVLFYSNKNLFNFVIKISIIMIMMINNFKRHEWRTEESSFGNTIDYITQYR